MANLSVLEDLVAADQQATSDNPFDDPALETPVEGPNLQPAARPGLAERFTMNFEAGSRYGTIGRSLQDHATDFRLRERKRFDSRYETFPQWESPAEGLVALSGQLAGAATGIENYIPIGWGVRIAKGVSWASTALRSRVMAGAIDAGAANLVIDSAIQGVEIAGGTRDEFSLTQLGASTALGTAAGAGFGAVAGRRTPEGLPDDVPADGPAARAGAGQQQNPFDEPGDVATAAATGQPQDLLPGPDGVLDAGTVTGNQALPPADASLAGRLPAPDDPAPIALPDEGPDGSVIAAEAAEDIALGDRLAAKARQVRNFGRLATGEPLETGAARAAMSDVADRLRADIEATKPKRLAGGRPMGLARFLASNGGLLDDADLRTITGGGNHFVPGYGALIQTPKTVSTAGRLSGRRPPMTLDQARELAVEAGYLADDGELSGGVSKSTTRDLLDALDEEFRGRPVYSVIDRENAATYNEAFAAYEEQLARLDQSLAEIGDVVIDDLPLEIRQRAVEIRMQDGIEPADALEQAILEDYYAGGLDVPLTREDGSDIGDGYDIPFFDDAAGRQEQRSEAGPGQQAADRSRPDRPGQPDGQGAAAARPGQRSAADARQQTIPGAEGLTPDQLAQRRADQPLKPKADQNLVMDDGLFGDSGRQDELFSTALPGGSGVRSRRAEGTLSDQAFTRLKDLSETLRDIVNVASVRQGITARSRKGQKIQGTFNTRTGSLRIRQQDDFDTFTHEVGHDVELKLGQPLADLLDGHSAEVKKLAYDGVKKGDELTEGFAEFFRLYMTNSAYVERQAPDFFEQFDQLMKTSQADMRDALLQVREAYSAWLKQPSDRAVASTIQPALRKGFVSTMRQDAKRHGLAGTLADYMHSVYGALFNRQHGLSRAVRALAQIHFDKTGKKLNLKAADDPSKIAQLSRGAQNAGHMDIYFGVTPYRGVQPATASLRDALIEAFDLNNAYARWSDEQAQEFGSYLWSRRALGEWDRYDAGLIDNPPDKLTRGDHELNIKTLEARNPRYKSAAIKVYDFSAGLWKKKLDAGLIKREQYEAGLEIQDYVPGLRSFDYDGDGQVRQGGKKGGSGKRGFVKQFRGSRRDVINPIDSLMTDAYETSMAIARNDVVKTLANLADTAGTGSSRIAERIPAIRFEGIDVDALQVVEKAAKQSGMDAIDAIVLRDAFEHLVGKEEVTIFKPAIINEKGEPIVFWRDGGELQALRLADGKFGIDMYNAMTSLGPQENNLLIDLFAIPSAILRAGITTTLEFIKANFIRDQVVSWVYYGQPLKRTASTLRGMGQEVFNADAARIYSQAGGIMGGAGTAALRTSFYKADLRALKKKGWAAQRLTSLKGWLEISELSETGLRVGLFNDFRQAALDRGLDDNEAVVEAAWRARDHIDFDRHGWLMGGLSRIVPFLNASLQGIDKTARQAMAPLARKVMGDSPLAGDDIAMGDAVKAWARIMVVGVTGLGIHALMKRQPEYDEINVRTRATHWMIKTGEKWYAVPKPFEMAAVINMFEAAYDAYVDADALAGERYVEGLFTVVAPPNVIEGNPALRYYFERKSGQNFFTGRDIVPDSLKGLEPWLQYTGRTSDFSKQFAEATGVSPIQTDHFITTFTGGHGRNALALYDWALSDKPLPGWDDAPITRRFIKDASRGANSSIAFWDQIASRNGQLENAARSYRTLFEGGDPAGARDYLARQDQLTKEFVAVSMMKAGARRLHPMLRARSAVQAINQVRRELSLPEYTGADGRPRQLDAIKRRAADDILSTMAMAEARNALVVAGARGYEARRMMPVETWHSELKALDADLFDALAARFASSKVVPFDTMQEIWPELRERLTVDGSQAVTVDLEAIGTAGGFELGGIRLPRRTEKPPVDALQ